MNHSTEKKTANLLLERGVIVHVTTPLFLWFGKKKTEIVIKAPTTEKFLEIALLFLEMNIQNTGEMELKEAFELFVKHGEKMSEIIALCVSSGGDKIPNLAKVLRRSLTQQEMSYLFHLVIAYGGIEDFINTIRLAEATRITKPMNLSPAEETS